MKKVNVKVVIGSNYGDECKGLATSCFSDSSKKCLNVLFNGGCQRGHTVDLKDGTRHIFHHFGSGTFHNAYTYFDKDFMLNPAIFVQEYDELLSLGVKPKCFVSPHCRISTPYDAFINQIVENSRGESRHGSCGFGIWETQKRYENSIYALNYEELISKTDAEIISYLSDIANKYLYERLKYYSIYDIPKEYEELIKSDGLKLHFLNDIRVMQSLIKICEFERLFSDFDTVVFEGAQGLALDESNKDNYPYITASKTTSYVPIERVKNLNCDIEVCYITRSYFTRHGAGMFPTECKKSTINGNIEDKTNVPNDYQQSIRYGLFDIEEFNKRINSDKEKSLNIRKDIKFSLFISHLNYTNNEIAGNCTIKDLSKYFYNIYLSSNKYGITDTIRGNK